MQRTRSGQISLGQTITRLQRQKTGCFYDKYSVDTARSALYHINKLRKLLRGFNEKLQRTRGY